MSNNMTADPELVWHLLCLNMFFLHSYIHNFRINYSYKVFFHPKNYKLTWRYSLLLPILLPNALEFTFILCKYLKGSYLCEQNTRLSLFALARITVFMNVAKLLLYDYKIPSIFIFLLTNTSFFVLGSTTERQWQKTIPLQSSIFCNIP